MRFGSLLQDLRYAARVLLKHPVLSITVIVTFSLGIGLSSTAFNITNGFIHKELGFEEEDRILVTRLTAPSRGIDDMGVTILDFAEFRRAQTHFEQLGGFAQTQTALSSPEAAPGEPPARRPQRHYGSLFTAGVFEALGVQPILGRTFREEDERPGSELVVIIHYDIWQDRFDGDPDVLGETVIVDGVERTIVGVMGQDFRFPMISRVWIPIYIDLARESRGEGFRFSAIGRLRDGVSAQQAEAEMTAIAAGIEQEFPVANEGVRPTIKTVKGALVPVMYYALFYTMLGAAVGVLMIGCVNVTNLLLARAAVRSQEVAVRSALGAGRGRLIKLLLTEVSLLALIGGAIGFYLGHLGLQWFLAQVDYVLTNAGGGEEMPFWITFEHDLHVAAFVIGVTALSALLAGLFPALRATAANVAEAMQGANRGSPGRRTGRLTGSLIVAEVAVSCVLLVLAGLFIQSLTQLAAVDLNYSTAGIYTARVQLPDAGYPDNASRLQFYDELLADLQAIPGVEAAALSDGLPPFRAGSWMIEPEGTTYERDEDYPYVRRGRVTPDYFRTFDAPVLRGRMLTAADRAGTLPVAVVNESLARSYFPEGDAVGRRFRVVDDDQPDAPWITIVGIVPDLKAFPLGGDGVPQEAQNPACFYVTFSQGNPSGYAVMALLTRGSPTDWADDVRATVANLDDQLALFMEMSMDGVVLRMVWFYPVFSSLFTAFGFGALFLASVGLYGVMSFAVTQRTREMGVRMALGARSGELVTLVMRKGVIRIAIGLAIGLALAMLAAYPLAILLFEVQGRETAVIVLVALTLAATGVLASFVPARRVTRIDPASALGSE